MPSTESNDDFAALRRNHLLALLGEADLAALQPHMRLVPLLVPDTVATAGKAMRHAWFPVEGVILILAAADDGTQRRIEIGTVGCEGMVGLPLFLGNGMASGDCFAQVQGESLRIDAAAFRSAAQCQPALADVLHRYAQALLVQVSQMSACNRLHSPVQRCARWLLMTSDRVRAGSFLLKQEFLAQMLGERRPTVSRVASQLQERGMITYSRGRIAILDRPRLEETACPCYGVVRGAFEDLLGYR